MKDGLRREMIAKREAHHSSGGHVNCIGIMDRFLHLPEFDSARCVLLYASRKGEVHTDGIILSALSLGKKVALPVSMKEEHALELYEIKSMEELSEGAFGIMEPARSQERRVQPEEVELVVVPGVSFDRRGHRLGYGMGYYDSLLKKVKGCKVGLAYDMQIVEHVPDEPHDVAVDMVVTQSETMVCRKLEAAGARRKFRVAVLASGRGSDFLSIVDAVKGGKLDISIAGLITDNPDALAAKLAAKNGIPAFFIPHASREELDEGVMKKLSELEPDLVVLAGYMKVIKSRELLSRYSGRMINIHPSLLPKYPGAHAQKDAFDAHEMVSGYTIHFVDESLDGGRIIHQEKVDISHCKSAEETAAKILEREHAGLPEVVGRFARGEIRP
ncbi:MAG: phosphoribosylglycinamide formyltransferase [Candidatus Micrarchaeota archaeon]|nr:phosphoribosylglycinamide formyltransferase [Candidatus Micrarchaeota archaeon]